MFIFWFSGEPTLLFSKITIKIIVHSYNLKKKKKLRFGLKFYFNLRKNVFIFWFSGEPTLLFSKITIKIIVHSYNFIFIFDHINEIFCVKNEIE